MNRDVRVAMNTGVFPISRHPYLLHLRLGFNLLLSPIYLWGVFLAAGDPANPRLWLGYLSLHLFLYGGTTAFNSFYDRDEGPIGGMFEPPPVDPGLLRFSLVVQALGLLPAALVGLPFLSAWLFLFLIFTAYSHPAVRFKANPGTALAAIAFGQGAVGFTLGWFAVSPPQGLLSPAGVWGMLSTALIVTGLYVISQSYQVQEDRARGDRTLPVMLGARRALLVACLPLAAGGLLLGGWVGVRLGWEWAGGLAIFFLALALWLVRRASRFEEGDVRRNFGWAMRFVTTASGGLSLFLLLHLFL
ncbi:MAG: UbiA family prenyltransferase [Trueperaceae bacterium]